MSDIEPSPTPVPLDEPPAPDEPDDTLEDLAPGSPLLGMPVRSLVRTASLQGLGLLAIALVILLWPDRTDRVLARLVGVGLGIYALNAAWGLARDRTQRRFEVIIAAAAAAGFSAALILQPTDSLRSSTQGAGAAVILVALWWVGKGIVGREFSAWVATRSVGMVIAGVLLISFPEQLLVAATSAAAGLFAAAGLIQVFTTPDDDADGSVISTVRSWVLRRTGAEEDRTILREKLYFEGETAPVRYARFIALMAFSAIIASVGVVVQSTAVVIGAMLIAPLMVPLMGTALSVTMGWPNRLKRCAGVSLSGIAVAISTGVLVGAVSPRTVDVGVNAEILSRISPTGTDLAIAIAAGAAGAYALARKDVSDSLPGVAVAIALVPPLVVVGLCWEQGAWSAGNGALLLFLTNAAAIIIAGGAMFVFVGAAPIRQVSDAQERLATGVVGALSFGAVIVILLLLNGTDLARAEVARASVDNVLAEWSSEHENFRVVDQRFADGIIEIDLTGPGRPPGLEELLSDLNEALGEDVEMKVNWIRQNQVTLNEDAGD